MKLIIEKEDVEEVQEMVWGWLGVRVPDGLAREALENSGGQAYDFGITDTEVRGQIMSYITEELVGRALPTYADKDESFFDEVVGRALELGWEVDDT